MKTRIDERRFGPKDDLLSELVNATLADERPLHTAKLQNIVQQLLVAGNATPTNSLTGGVLNLIQNPAEHAS